MGPPHWSLSLRLLRQQPCNRGCCRDPGRGYLTPDNGYSRFAKYGTCLQVFIDSALASVAHTSAVRLPHNRCRMLPRLIRTATVRFFRVPCRGQGTLEKPEWANNYIFRREAMAKRALVTVTDMSRINQKTFPSDLPGVANQRIKFSINICLPNTDGLSHRTLFDFLRRERRSNRPPWEPFLFPNVNWTWKSTEKSCKEVKT